MFHYTHLFPWTTSVSQNRCREATKNRTVAGRIDACQRECDTSWCWYQHCWKYLGWKDEICIYIYIYVFFFGSEARWGCFGKILSTQKLNLTWKHLVTGKKGFVQSCVTSLFPVCFESRIGQRYLAVPLLSKRRQRWQPNVLFGTAKGKGSTEFELVVSVVGIVMLIWAYFPLGKSRAPTTFQGVVSTMCKRCVSLVC